MYRLLLLLAIPALASGYQTMSVYADVNKDRDFFLWTYPWLIDNLSGDIRVMYYLLGSGRHSVPQMCALEQLDDSAFLQADYLRCEAQGLPAKECLCRNGIDPEEHRYCVHYGSHKAIDAAVAYHELNVNASPIIRTHATGPIHDLFGIDLLKAVCSSYPEYNKPPGCVTLTGNGNTTMSSFDRHNSLIVSCK